MADNRHDSSNADTRTGHSFLERVACLPHRQPLKPQVKLADAQPDDRAADNHPLDLGCALKNGEDLSVQGPSVHKELMRVLSTFEPLRTRRVCLLRMRPGLSHLAGTLGAMTSSRVSECSVWDYPMPA
jgi:hypothetical protein